MTTTTGILPPAVQQSYDYKILSTPTPQFIHKIPSMPKEMPANGGDTLRMERYNALKTATVPLGNTGIHPPPQPLTSVFIDAKMSFYGTYVLLNEQVTLQNQSRVLDNAALRLGVSLRQSEDELSRDMLKSTASFINAVAGGNGDNPTQISRADCDTVVRTLQIANAVTISAGIEGEDKFGSAPVRDAYMVLGNNALIGDLEKVTGFIPKIQYPNDSDTLRPEWGTISNLRFLLSSIGSKTLGGSMKGNDVYNLFCCGMEAYAGIEQQGYSAQFIYRPAIYGGPLALNASAGYKFAEVPRITNDAWVINFRVTLSV